MILVFQLGIFYDLYLKRSYQLCPNKIGTYNNNMPGQAIVLAAFQNCEHSGHKVISSINLKHQTRMFKLIPGVKLEMHMKLSLYSLHV